MVVALILIRERPNLEPKELVNVVQSDVTSYREITSEEITQIIVGLTFIRARIVQRFLRGSVLKGIMKGYFAAVGVMVWLTKTAITGET